VPPRKEYTWLSTQLFMPLFGGFVGWIRKFVAANNSP
jgi:hypothetical protein